MEYPQANLRMKEVDKNSEITDVDKLVICMEEEMNRHKSVRDENSEICVINKVEENVRRFDKKAYKPIVVSIGPYHHKTPSLLHFEGTKLNFLEYILKLNPTRVLDDYLNAIREVEKQARSCYGEEIEMDDEEFCWMLLLDGCILLVFLCGSDGLLAPKPESKGYEYNERVGMKTHERKENVDFQEQISQASTGQEHAQNVQAGQLSWQSQQTGENITNDVFLLENQIPFFVLQRIYEVFSGNHIAAGSFLTVKAAEYVENMILYHPKAIQPSTPKDFHHLLHLCHMYLRPSQIVEEVPQYGKGSQFFRFFHQLNIKYFKFGHRQKLNAQNPKRGLRMPNHWHGAVQYHEAGIQFNRKVFSKSNPHSLLDVEFREGVIEIPHLHIDDLTGTILRNMIAFEQTSPQFGNDVTAYVVFMSQLMSTPDDVRLLADRGIIAHHMLRDENVSTLFTRFTQGLDFDFNGPFYLKYVCQTMEVYYRRQQNRWIVRLRHSYRKNPWMFKGVLAAFVFLVCTLTRLVFSLLFYLNPQVVYVHRGLEVLN